MGVAGKGGGHRHDIRIMLPCVGSIHSQRAEGARIRPTRQPASYREMLAVEHPAPALRLRDSEPSPSPQNAATFPLVHMTTDCGMLVMLTVFSCPYLPTHFIGFSCC